MSATMCLTSGSLFSNRRAAPLPPTNLLEFQPRSHLHRPCRSRRCDRPSRHRVHRRTGQVEVRVIEYVEGFPAELQALALADFHVLVEREIDADEAGAVQNVAARCAETEAVVG